MTQKRKRHGRRFKIAAAQVVLSGDMTVREPSEELGVKDSTLRRRAQEYESMGDGAFPGNGSPRVNKDYEIVRLGKRMEELEQENELLRNFRAFLSQDRA
ncbi:transposase [uncultured Parolsenella sp.]|uniref:transposase n=1 Tax=uncultured Parolsenella sp. TaxID=2083008 RepID=UPI0027DB08A5|nr:transposase [uncultured Parolsenella sp.]